MEKKFVCTIDFTEFNTKEALIEHLLENYSIKQEPGENSSDIMKKIQEAFPDANIEVTYNHINEKPVPFVEIIISNCGAQFSFYIDDSLGEENRGNIVYKTTDDAIDYYKSMLGEKDKLVQAVVDKFGAEKVVVNQVFQSEGYSDDSDSISFSFFVKEKEYYGCYEFEGIDKCLRSLDGYFARTVEGLCRADYGRYNSANTIYVDGIDLRQLAQRAKKLKVEILEFN